MKDPHMTALTVMNTQELSHTRSESEPHRLPSIKPWSTALYVPRNADSMSIRAMLDTKDRIRTSSGVKLSPLYPLHALDQLGGMQGYVHSQLPSLLLELLPELFNAHLALGEVN